MSELRTAKGALAWRADSKHLLSKADQARLLPLLPDHDDQELWVAAREHGSVHSLGTGWPKEFPTSGAKAQPKVLYMTL